MVRIIVNIEYLTEDDVLQLMQKGAISEVGLAELAENESATIRKAVALKTTCYSTLWKLSNDVDPTIREIAKEKLQGM